MMLKNKLQSITTIVLKQSKNFILGQTQLHKKLMLTSRFNDYHAIYMHSVKKNFQQQQQIKQDYNSEDSAQLGNSDFSKELGLNKQMQQLKNMQQSSENAKVGVHSVAIAVCIIGGLLFIMTQIITNPNHNFSKKLKLSKNQQIEESCQEEGKALLSIYNNQIKYRSTIKSKFLSQVKTHITKLLRTKMKKSQNLQIQPQATLHQPQSQSQYQPQYYQTLLLSQHHSASAELLKSLINHLQKTKQISSQQAQNKFNWQRQSNVILGLCQNLLMSQILRRKQQIYLHQNAKSSYLQHKMHHLENIKTSESNSRSLTKIQSQQQLLIRCLRFTLANGTINQQFIACKYIAESIQLAQQRNQAFSGKNSGPKNSKLFIQIKSNLESNKQIQIFSYHKRLLASKKTISNTNDESNRTGKQLISAANKNNTAQYALDPAELRHVKKILQIKLQKIKTIEQLLQENNFLNILH